MLNPNEPIPDVIDMGAYPVTKERYLEMVKNGEDVSSATPMKWPGSTATYFPGDINGTDIVDGIIDTLDKLVEKKTSYMFGEGKDSSVSPYEQNPVYLDEASFAGWTLYELGIINSEEATHTLPTILGSSKLVDVTPVNKSTSSDTDNFKLEIVEKAQVGDLLLFDKYSPNDNVGFYMGSGRVYTQNEGMTTESDTGMSMLYMLSEDGQKYEPTSVLQSFNGTILRPKDFNHDVVEYYYKGLGI